MSKLKTLEFELDQYKTLQLVTGALGDIAGMHLKKIRTDIKHDQDYFEEVSQIYQLIKTIASKANVADPNIKLKNGKSIAVLITSNSGLYGGLDRDLCRYFVNQTENQPYDRIIIGKAAKDFFSALKNPATYLSVILKQDEPDVNELRDLVNKVKNYSRILFFHSKFVTLLNQEIAVSDLTKPAAKTSAKDNQFDYILEPEVRKMLSFFGTQLLDSMVHSLFLQAELSRTAARMISMDQAEVSTEDLVNKEKSLIIHEFKNRISLQSLDVLNKIKR